MASASQKATPSSSCCGGGDASSVAPREAAAPPSDAVVSAAVAKDWTGSVTEDRRDDQRVAPKKIAMASLVSEPSAKNASAAGTAFHFLFDVNTRCLGDSVCVIGIV